MKDPSFPFYAQDFLIDTLRWDRSMQGLHVALLAESWANGGLIDEGGKPLGLGSTDVEVWLKIKHKWILKSGYWFSPKLETVRAERIEFKKRQSEKGILSAKKRKLKSTTVQPNLNQTSTGGQPIEDESESEKESEDEKKIKEYDLWTEQIIAGNDHVFEQMFLSEIIPPGVHIQFWIMDHRDLLNRYPKMRPPTQDAFRKSCLKHVRENYKKPTHGNSKTKQSAADLAEAFRKRGMQNADG